MAEGPIYLGTFVRNTLEHPELFTAKCPKCGRTILPYGYNGSPLSGRVDLEATCECGWDDYVMVSGWRVRSEALHATSGYTSLPTLSQDIACRHVMAYVVAYAFPGYRLPPRQDIRRQAKSAKYVGYGVVGYVLAGDTLGRRPRDDKGREKLGAEMFATVVFVCFLCRAEWVSARMRKL